MYFKQVLQNVLRNSKKNTVDDKFSFPILISTATYIVFYFVFANRYTNLIYKNLADFVFIVVFFVCYLLVTRNTPKGENIATSVILSLLLCMWIIRNFIAIKNSTYPGTVSMDWLRFQFPMPIYLAGITCVAMICAAGFKRHGYKYRVHLAILYAVLCSLPVFSRNPFLDIEGGLTHSHAYETSIFNVLSKAPFSEYNKSIYGHYAIFYRIPVKIIETIGITRFTAVAYVITLLAFIACLCIFLTLNKLIKSDGIFILGMLATGSISFQMFYRGNIYQEYPHRVLFFSLLCFVFTNLSLHKYFTWIVTIILGLSIIWNTETGVVCLIASGMYFFCKRMDFSEVNLWAITKGILIEVVRAIGIFFSSILIVNIWNLLNGGSVIGIKAFIYPIGSANYKIIEMLSLDIPTIWHSWFGFSILSLVFISVILKMIFFSKVKKALEVLPISVMGLGGLLIYMNRPGQLYLSVCYPMIIIMLSVLLQLLYDRKQLKTLSLGGGIVMCAVVGVLTIQATDNLNIDSLLMNRMNSTWNIDAFNTLIDEIQKSVPEGTVGFGRGIPEIYACMFRDTGIYTLDWTDIELTEHEIKGYVYSLVENEERFLSNKININPEYFTERGFFLVKEYVYSNGGFCDEVYQLWERSSQN